MGWLDSAASLATMRPTATVGVSSCTRRHASDCRLCAAACPKDAITLEPLSAVVDDAACVGCGVCVAACPVGAIAGVGQVPSAVAARIRDGATLRCDVARLLAPDAEGDVVDVPCIAAVHPEAVAAGALSAGRARIVPGPCDACPVGSASRVRAVLDDAAAACAGGGEIVEEPVTEPQPKRRWGRTKPAERARPEVSRRALFGLRAAPEPAAGADERPVALPSSASPREVLLSLAPQAPVPMLTVDVSCTACGGCVAVCPVDALELEQGVLMLTPSRCVDCRECVRVCPESAIHAVGRVPEAEPTTLAAVAQQHCDRCSRPLGPGEQGMCHNCRVRGSLAAGIL